MYNFTPFSNSGGSANYLFMPEFAQNNSNLQPVAVRGPQASVFSGLSPFAIPDFINPMTNGQNSGYGGFIPTFNQMQPFGTDMSFLNPMKILAPLLAQLTPKKSENKTTTNNKAATNKKTANNNSLLKKVAAKKAAANKAAANKAAANKAAANKAAAKKAAANKAAANKKISGNLDVNAILNDIFGNPTIANNPALNDSDFFGNIAESAVNRILFEYQIPPAPKKNNKAKKAKA